jgi:hypothetical protein
MNNGMSSASGKKPTHNGLGPVRRARVHVLGRACFPIKLHENSN